MLCALAGWAVCAVLISLEVCSAFAAGRAPEDLLARSREQQARGQWASADSLAAAAIAGFERQAAPDSVAFAEALLAVGRARWKLASFADGVGLAAAQRALGILERRLGPDHLEVAAAHMVVSHLLLETGEVEPAIAHAERALQVRRTLLADDDPLLVDTWTQLGSARRVQEDFTAAREAFAAALAILERQPEPNGVRIATVLGQDATCLIRQGRLDPARDQLHRADALLVAELGLDAAERRSILSELSDLERTAGDLATAIDHNREAIRVLEVSRPDDRLGLAHGRADLGLLLMYFGDWAGARSAFLAALPVYVSQYGETHRRVGLLKSRIGVTVGGLGDHRGALKWLRESVAVSAVQTEPQETSLAIDLRWQAEMHSLLGELATARELCERAIATARAARKPWGEAVIAPSYLLVSVLERIGDLPALASAAQTLPQIAEEFGMNSPVTRTNVNYWSARAARRLGERERAWALALQTEQIARERVVLNARALPDRRALELSDRLSRNLDLVLDMTGEDELRVAEAWDRLVRSRGVVRAEMTRRRLPRDLLADPEVTAARAQWIEAQAQLARERVKTVGAEPDAKARVALDELRDAAEEAEREMRALLAGRFEPAPGTDVGLAEVLAKLAPDQALVSMAELDAGTDSSRVIAFVRGGAQRGNKRLELGASLALRDRIESWRAALGTPPGASATEAAQAEAYGRRLGARVRESVWDPLAAHLDGAREVWIVADGPLTDLPWHALPDGKYGYLVETGPLFVLLEAEREALGADRLPARSSLLAVGAPDYDLDAVPTGPATERPPLDLALRSGPDPCSGGTLPAFEPLPESAVEAAGATSLWKDARGERQATLLVAAQADEPAVRREVVGKTVLHFATHGYVTPDTCRTDIAPGSRGVGGVAPLVAPPRPASPWAARRVWLALAGANRAASAGHASADGLLTAEEVVTLDLFDAHWVVLSACHSGWAEQFSGEGSSGLRRAFRIAGARTVISSHWALDDSATREWMAAFYEAAVGVQLDAPASFATACRSNLRDRRAAGRTTHPFYWAGFTAVGR